MIPRTRRPIWRRAQVCHPAHRKEATVVARLVTVLHHQASTVRAHLQGNMAHHHLRVNMVKVLHNMAKALPNTDKALLNTVALRVALRVALQVGITGRLQVLRVRDDTALRQGLRGTRTLRRKLIRRGGSLFECACE